MIAEDTRLECVLRQLGVEPGEDGGPALRAVSPGEPGARGGTESHLW